MDQDFLNENKEEQKTEQAPSQTENKEAAASQAVPTDVAEEKKEVHCRYILPSHPPCR